MSDWKLIWCRLMHDDVAYGGGGVYWCRRCLCRFPVPWLPSLDGPQGTVAETSSVPAELTPGMGVAA